MVLSLTSFEDVHEIAKDFEGWLDIAEATLLYETASKLTGKGVIVEIGSWCAKSLTYISLAALNNGFNKKIYSIDPFLTSKNEPNGKYETFISNLTKMDLSDKITHLKEKSQDAGMKFDEDIEFIFIDGFHKYDAVKSDVELFFPKIVNNGYMAIHDVGCYKGPTQLLIELSQRDDIKVIDYKALTVLVQKVETLREEEREKNKLFMEGLKIAMENSNLIE